MPAISVMIKPSSSYCNMRCKYCFYADVSDHREVKSAGFMNETTHENLVRRAMEYAEHSATFAFQGGEPTLSGLDYFRRHVELCRKYAKPTVEVQNTIQTNGYLIDEEWAEFLAENHFLVGISLDGPKDIHDFFRKDAAGEGTFNRIRHSITLLNRYHVEYNILCVVTDTIAKNVNKVMNFFINNGFEYLQFIPCIEGFDGNKNEWALTAEHYGEFLVKAFNKYYSCFLKNKFLSVRNFDNYLNILAGYPAEHCGMNGRCSANFIIEGDGNSYPCDFYVLDEYCGGNVNEKSFREIYESEGYRNFVEPSYCMSEECKDCRWMRICRGGCRRYREPFENGKLSLSWFCKSYQRFFDECYDDLVDMVRKIMQRGGR